MVLAFFCGEFIVSSVPLTFRPSKDKKDKQVVYVRCPRCVTAIEVAHHSW